MDLLNIPAPYMHLVTRPLRHFPIGLSMSQRVGFGEFVMIEFAGKLYRQDFSIPLPYAGLASQSAYGEELKKAIRVIKYKIDAEIALISPMRFEHDA
jgi:hypothetical protein